MGFEPPDGGTGGYGGYGGDDGGYSGQPAARRPPWQGRLFPKISFRPRAGGGAQRGGRGAGRRAGRRGGVQVRGAGLWRAASGWRQLFGLFVCIGVGGLIFPVVRCVRQLRKPDGVCIAFRHAFGNTVGHAQGNCNTEEDGHAYAYCHAETNGYAGKNANAHCYAGENTHADGHAGKDAYPNGNSV